MSATSTAYAQAIDVLVINGASQTSEPGTTADITGNLGDQLQAAAPAGTTVNVTVADTTPANLGGYQQIWDIRFSNVWALTPAEQSQFLAYLQGGHGMFIMGENSGFMTRNNSVIAFVQLAGGGSLTFNDSPDSTQTVLPPATGPNAIPGNTVGYLAPGSVTSPGTGVCLTRDGSGNCSAIAFPVGTLANAPTGSLTVVFDVNFMQAVGGTNMDLFLKNLINFVGEQAGGGGGVNFSGLAHTPYQLAVAGSVDTLFGSTTGELSQLMVAAAGLGSADAQRQALERMGNSFLQLPLDTVMIAVREHYFQVGTWLDQLQFTGPGMSVASTADGGRTTQLAYLNGAASGDLGTFLADATGTQGFHWSNGRMAAFLNAGYLGGAYGSTTNQAGFDYQGFAGTGGVAYAIDERIAVGGGLGFSRLTGSVEDNRGDTSTNVYSALLFGRYRDPSGFYGDAIGSISFAKYSYDRNIDVGAVHLEANGDANAWQGGGTVRGGYNFTWNGDPNRTGDGIGRAFGGPFGQLQYIHVHMDDYLESGAGTASLLVGEQSTDSFAGRIGVRGGAVVDVGPARLMPTAMVAYEHEFADTSRTVDARFFGGVSAPFAVPVDAGPRDFLVLGVGLSTKVASGVDVGIGYEGRLSGEASQNAVGGRLKVTF